MHRPPQTHVFTIIISSVSVKRKTTSSYESDQLKLHFIQRKGGLLFYKFCF